MGNPHYWGVLLSEFAAFRKISGFMLLSANGGLLNQLFENPIIKMQHTSYVREMCRNTSFLNSVLSHKINRAPISQGMEAHLFAPNQRGFTM